MVGRSPEPGAPGKARLIDVNPKQVAKSVRLSIWGGMTYPPSTLERAFTLARSGEYESVNEIRMQLKRERFDQVEAHLAGHSINRELRALCVAAQRLRA